MGKLFDALGTLATQFQIGIGGTGLRRLRFKNGFSGDLEWTPTANRTITIPDSSGTVALFNGTVPAGQESLYFLNAAGTFTAPTMTTVFSSNLTLDTAAYADGDVLSDLLTVTSAVQSGAAAQVYEISVIDKDDQKQPLELLFFDRSITLSAKNTAWAVSDSDMDNFLGMVPIYSGDYVDLGGNAVATIAGLSVGIKANSGTSIYLATRSRGAGTYTANGLRVKLSIRQG